MGLRPSHNLAPSSMFAPGGISTQLCIGVIFRLVPIIESKWSTRRLRDGWNESAPRTSSLDGDRRNRRRFDMSEFHAHCADYTSPKTYHHALVQLQSHCFVEDCDRGGKHRGPGRVNR
jgi:hypothetical protein